MALQVIEMMNDIGVSQMVQESWKAEIERAIYRARQPKRSELDKWFRQQWYREAAVRKWPEERQRHYRERGRCQRQTSEEEDAWRELKKQRRKGLGLDERVRVA